MTTPAGIYPFSTQDGKSIPLDIIKPTGIMVRSFPAAGGIVSHCTIPDGSVVGVLTSSVECIVRFGAVDIPATLVDDTLYTNAVFIPAGAIVAVVLPAGILSVIGRGAAGTLFIQLIEQWAGLGLPNQYGRK